MHFLSHYRMLPWLLVGLLQACHSSSSSTIGHTSAEAFTVGGHVTGSNGAVTLACNGQTTTVAGNGPFTCSGTLGADASYAVTVLSAPGNQTCEVAQGSGSIADANVISVVVACAQTAFDVTVSMSGLLPGASASVALGSTSQVLTANGDVAVTLNGTVGEQVPLAIAAQPAGQLCVFNLNAFSFSAVAAHVAIACVRNMQIPSGAAATMVFGQTDFVTGTAPQAPVPVGEFNTPAGRVAGAENGWVFVCEYAGNQVSALNPNANSSVDFRLGVDVSQAVGARYGAQDLSTPTAVATSDTQLAVASAEGARVLLYNGIPTAAAAAADVVVGQAGFGSAPVVTCSPNNFVSPTDVTFAAGKLFVADSGCNRVVIFDPVPSTNGAAATLVLGQFDFTSHHPNGDNGVVGAGTLDHPGSVWANANTLFVADAYNNRVLVWSSLPTLSGQPADLVLGQTSFTSAASGVGPDAMAIPYALVADEHTLFVADALNNRVLLYPLPLPTVGTPVATGVLGQADFVSNGHNAPSSVPSAQNLYQPTGLGFFRASLLVNDGLNFRVLGYASR